MKIHHVADHERTAFVTTKDARRKRPGHFQLTDVVGVDLVKLRVPGASIITGLDAPIVWIVQSNLSRSHSPKLARRTRQLRANHMRTHFSFASASSTVLMPRTRCSFCAHREDERR